MTATAYWSWPPSFNGSAAWRCQFSWTSSLLLTLMFKGGAGQTCSVDSPWSLWYIEGRFATGRDLHESKSI
jgi:hypothetical protein